jgi:DNA-binding NarL/FixJ family response regulator
MTTVLICDDRRQVRDGLTRVMSRVSGVQRIEHSEYGELLSRYSRHRMDLVLVGTHRAATMGVESIRQLVAAQPQANVIAFGAPHDVDNIAAAIASGARGFLRWDSVPSDAVGRMPQAVGGTVALPASGRANGTEELRLTEREMQVLQGMSKGLSNGQIGRNLFLSEDTIKTHARRLFRKLGAHDRAEAVALGFRRCFIS